jgi:hypothetical protein
LARKLRNLANYLKKKHADRCAKEALRYLAPTTGRCQNGYGKWIEMGSSRAKGGQVHGKGFEE